MNNIRLFALAYALALGLVTTLNYIPGLTDADGRVFGIFALDVYDDLLHFGSAAWAGIAAWLSTRACIVYFKVFGTLYLLDGLLGLATGSGYLDLAILVYGVQALPLQFKVLANFPHIALGGFAVFIGFVLARREA
nr:hypothetical protein [uncultured Roseateles sp.]